MKIVATTLMAVSATFVLAACESAGGGEYDGVSRFASAPGPYSGPGSPPREPAPPEPDLPVQTPDSQGA